MLYLHGHNLVINGRDNKALNVMLMDKNGQKGEMVLWGDKTFQLKEQLKELSDVSFLLGFLILLQNPFRT